MAITITVLFPCRRCFLLLFPGVIPVARFGHSTVYVWLELAGRRRSRVLRSKVDMIVICSM